MSIETILRSHLARYPDMRIQDLYKLIHQAAMGSEHAILNPEGAQKWMERELAELGVGPDEAVIDLISADEQIMRVHLRPYVAQGGDPETLLNGFIRTANEFHGDKDVLKNYWKTAKEIEHFSLANIDGFFEPLEAQNFPAVHHSLDYERFYRPAYRVVWRKFIA
ncbi:MAG: hypothetical protein QM730_27620 [Anaerolineales bacterium]